MRATGRAGATGVARRSGARVLPRREGARVLDRRAGARGLTRREGARGLARRAGALLSPTDSPVNSTADVKGFPTAPGFIPWRIFPQSRGGATMC